MTTVKRIMLPLFLLFSLVSIVTCMNEGRTKDKINQKQDLNGQLAWTSPFN